MQNPLYQGTQHTPARVPQAAVSPQHPFADNFLKSAAAQTQQALDLESAIRDRQEYTLEQNRSAALQAAHQALDTEMLQRLNIADGEDGSLYDANGILIKSELDELRSRYLSVADAWTSGFTTDQGRAAATQAQQQYRAAVTNAINSKVLAGLKTRAKNAMQNNIKACISRGNYQGAYDAVNIAEADKRISKAEKAVLVDDINTARYEYEIDKAPNAESLAATKNLLESSEFFKTPSGAAIANKMQKRIDAMLNYQSKERSVEEVLTSTSTEAAQGQDADPASGKSSSSGSSKTLKVKPAQPPPASPGYVYRHYAIYGSNLDSPKAQKNAYGLLLRDAYSRKEIDGEAENELRRFGNSLHLLESTVSGIIKERRDSLTAKLAPFNATDAIKALKKNFDAGIQTRNAQLQATHENNAEHLDYWKRIYAMHDAQIDSVLEQAEDEFYDMFPDIKNKNKNDVEQARAFQQILNKCMQENKTLSQNPAHSWAYLSMNTYFKRYDTSENNAAKAAALDAERADRYKKAIEQDQKVYESIKNNPAIMNAYYRGGRAGAYARKLLIEALAYQAHKVKIDSPMDTLSKAATLPNTTDQLIIYIPTNTDESSPLAKWDSFITKRKGGMHLVKIVKTDAVSAPVPSVLFQETFELLGKKDNHFYFNNSIFTFSKKPKVKQAQPLSGLYEGYSEDYTEDGLPPLGGWESTPPQEGIFAGVSLDAEDDMPDTPLPF